MRIDEPFPNNLPVVPSCNKCNNGFSKDETYFASAIECVLVGTTNLKKIEREVIRNTLEHNLKLHERIKNSFTGDGLVIEHDRFENIILKCAYGHIKYENSETEFRKPQSIWFNPIHLLSQEEKKIFVSVSELYKVPEVGRVQCKGFLSMKKVIRLKVGLLCRKENIVILFQFLRA